MSPDEHNRVLGYLFLAYLGLQVLGLIIALFVFIFMFGMFRTMPGGDESFFLIFAVVMVITLVFSIGLLVPIAAAAYLMLKQRPGARGWGIAASIVSLLNIPLGTAIGIYGLWFLFSEEGKAFYLGSSNTFGLPPPPPESWRQ